MKDSCHADQGSLNAFLCVQHPSLALWGEVDTVGDREADQATAEMMSLCRTAPPGAARRVRQLLSVGATHPWKRVNGDTALHLASAAGSTEVRSRV